MSLSFAELEAHEHRHAVVFYNILGFAVSSLFPRSSFRPLNLDRRLDPVETKAQ